MSQVLNLIKNKILFDSFYIPSINKEIKGTTLTVSQYNHLLELSLERDYETSSKYILATDDFIKNNLETLQEVSYFDKVFILLQMKLNQNVTMFGITSETYKETLRNRCKELDLTTFQQNYNHNGINIELGFNSFEKSVELNKNTLASEDYEINNTLTSEILRSITKVTFEGSEIALDEINPVELVNTLPASFIDTFNNFNTRVGDKLIEINKFVYKNEDISFYPTLDVMLL